MLTAKGLAYLANSVGALLSDLDVDDPAEAGRHADRLLRVVCASGQVTPNVDPARFRAAVVKVATGHDAS